MAPACDARNSYKSVKRGVVGFASSMHVDDDASHQQRGRKELDRPL